MAEKWNGRSVGEALEFFERGKLSIEVLNAVIDSWLQLPSLGIPLAFLYFPMPFLKIWDCDTHFPVHSSKDQFSWAVQESGDSIELLRKFAEIEVVTVELPGIDSPEMELRRFHDDIAAGLTTAESEFCRETLRLPAAELETRGLSRIIVNHRKLKAQLMNEFSAYLDKKRKSPTAHLWARPRGKRKEPPCHRLRDLSTLRLKRAGFTRLGAKEYVKECLGSHPGDPNAVLPSYASSNWTEAIQRAEAHIIQLCPPPESRNSSAGTVN